MSATRGTRESVRRQRSVPPVQEQMLKRDAELALAMQSLEVVAHKVAASVTKFVDLTSPAARTTPSDPTTVLAHDSDFPEAFGLVGEISRVTHHLKLLQAAVDRATRRRRRSIAAEN